MCGSHHSIWMFEELGSTGGTLNHNMWNWLLLERVTGRRNTHRSPEARGRDEPGGVEWGSGAEKRGGCRDVHCPTSVSWGCVVPAVANVEHLAGCTQSSPWTFCTHALSHITPYTQSDQITTAKLTCSRIMFDIPRALFTSVWLQIFKLISTNIDVCHRYTFYWSPTMV